MKSDCKMSEEKKEYTTIIIGVLFCPNKTEQELLTEVEELKRKVSLGFDINSQDCNGDTNLHMYVKDVFYPTVKVLCEAGANVNIKDNNGISPIQTAKSNKNATKYGNWAYNIVSILIKHGAVE